MNILFFDTETTGKADFRRPPDAAGQPRLVQLGMLLTDEKAQELACVDVIVKPEGFEIPAEASATHGITTERALALGVNRKAALKLFRDFWEMADLVVAHNIQYDQLVIDGEIYRLLGGWKQWGKAQEVFCTMQAMTPVCRLPGNYGDFKWPKLQEAHKHCFGEEFKGAHGAMADVRACARVFYWLKERQQKAAEETKEVTV